MRSSHVRVVIVALLGITFVAPAYAQQSPWVAPEGTNTVHVPNSYKVGIGATPPASILHIAGPGGVGAVTMDTPGAQRFRMQTIPGIANWAALTLNSNYNGSGWLLDETTQNGWFFKIDGRGVNEASVFNGLWLYRIPSGAGAHTNEVAVFGVTNGYAHFKDKVGIGTAPDSMPDAQLQVVGTLHVTSNVVVDGNIAAKYQDIAEWVPVSETLSPGTVVVLHPFRENEVTASSQPYDTAVAGVVSSQPGIVLGEASPGKAMIATTGRVMVHVDARQNPIRIGDLLVSSKTPGTAMRSNPVEIKGRKFHQPGTVIGKALQALPGGESDILVLLSLQ